MTTMRRFLAVAFAAALVLSVAVPVMAAKPPDGPTSIALTTAAPHFGGTVAFAVTFSKADSKYDYTGRAGGARIEVLCYQFGVLVYGEAGTYLDTFLLGGGGSIWVYQFPNTPASCVANLFRFDNSGPVQTYVVLASTSFDAAG
jgi:hypothetical protein